MKILILAHPDDDTAARVATVLRCRHPIKDVWVVTAEEIALGPHWAHRLDNDRVHTRLVLHDGCALNSDEISVVFNRLMALQPLQFARAESQDREYATMELFALCLSWLAGLGCPIINPPSPSGLGGPSLGVIGWQLLAAQAGLRVPTLRLTSSLRRAAKQGLVPAYPQVLPTDQPATLLEPLGCARASLLVVGQQVIGDLPSSLSPAARRLAGLAGAELLQVHFCSIPHSADQWVFSGATSCPALTDPKAVDATADLLEQKIRPDL